MYNGQFFKGLIHVVIFAVLVSITEYHGIFGIFIGAWVLYQSFEAYHTARALRDGQPLPDPLGLNEVGNWLNLGTRTQHPGVPPAGQPPASPGGFTPPAQGAYQPPYTAQTYQPPYQSPYQTGYQAPYTPPASGFTPVAGVTDPAASDPTIPGGVASGPDAAHPIFWQRKEPIGAIILIALGLLFLLGQLDLFHGRLIEFAWPLLLIGVGVWLVVRRIGESHGGPK